MITVQREPDIRRWLKTGVDRDAQVRSTIIICLATFMFFPTLAQDELELTNCPEGYELAMDRHVIKVTDEMPSWPGCEKIEFPAYREECTNKAIEIFEKQPFA